MHIMLFNAFVFGGGGSPIIIYFQLKLRSIKYDIVMTVKSELFRTGITKTEINNNNNYRIYITIRST